MTLQRKHSRSTQRASRPARARPGRRRWLAAGLVVGVAVLAVLLANFVDRAGVAPRLLGRYVQQRSLGHAEWIEATGHWANQVLQELDRGDLLPRLQLPKWAGVHAKAGPGPRPTVVVTLPEQFRDALGAAKPGDTFTFAPGIYPFAGRSLKADRPGTEAAPITVRAETPGSVTLEFDLLDGFVVSAPHWTFENLTIRGVCARQEDCEHAFHVVGGAHHVVIRNNTLRDFNAQIKVNGNEGMFPDGGRIADNSLFNTAPRRTSLPVTPIDLVAASRWTIEGNLIADFVKDGGDFTSYGAFAKGGGAGTAFLRNVVLCEHRLRGAPGRRVGLSFGGGGSDAGYCRDRRCIVEHDDGLIASNLIASCSDEGVYINRSPRSQLIHNTILDTAGVDVRFPESTAIVAGNLIDGTVRVRDGGILDLDENMTTPLWSAFLGRHPVRDLFADAGAIDLRFLAPAPRTSAPKGEIDLCGTRRTEPAAMGAFEDFSACSRRAAN